MPLAAPCGDRLGIMSGWRRCSARASRLPPWCIGAARHAGAGSGARPHEPVAAFSVRCLLAPLRVGLGLWIVLLMPLAQAVDAVYLVLTLQTLWGIGATAAEPVQRQLGARLELLGHRRRQSRTAAQPRALHRHGPAAASRRPWRSSWPASLSIGRRWCSSARSPSGQASGSPGASSARPSWRRRAPGERDRATALAADAAVRRLRDRRGLRGARRQQGRLRGGRCGGGAPPPSSCSRPRQWPRSPRSPTGLACGPTAAFAGDVIAVAATGTVGSASVR